MTHEIHNLWALTVWYNPKEEVIDKICTFATDVEGVIIVDNSPSANEALAARIPGSVYIPNGENLGIAYALNVGMRKAIEFGADLLLTMDQDSAFAPGDFARYLDLYRNAPYDDIFIFSPVHITVHDLPHYDSIFTTMTSGNLVDVSIWQQVGPWRDDFFIDLVDDEICCRAKSKGFNIIITYDLKLIHNLGNGVVKSKIIPGKQFRDHPAWRYYYFVRNMRTLIDIYPTFRHYYSTQLRKLLKRLFLYDHIDRHAKIRNAWHGWCDYRRGIYGKNIRQL